MLIQTCIIHGTRLDDRGYCSDCSPAHDAGSIASLQARLDKQRVGFETLNAAFNKCKEALQDERKKVSRLEGELETLKSAKEAVETIETCGLGLDMEPVIPPPTKRRSRKKGDTK